MRSTTSSGAELGRVDHVGVLGRLHLGGIPLVAELQIRCEPVSALFGPLDLPPSCPLGRVGDEVDLHLGVGADDRPDVAAFDDGVADGARAGADAHA